MAEQNHAAYGLPHSPTAARSFWLILVALIVEGYDLQAANFAAPAIVESLGLARSQVGPLLSASLVGVLFGALLIGPLGDQVGRKRILVGCCAAYGLLSFGAAAVTGLPELIAIRFLIGIGLGGFLPNALALAGELAPVARQGRQTAMVGIGITLGGVLAGAMSAQLMPRFGWPSVFVAGGVLPLAVAVMLALALPPTPVIQSDAGRGGNALAGVRVLLSPAYRAKSIAIWLVFAAVLMNVYLLNGWIPLLMRASGLTIANSAWVATGYQAGGVVGGIAASLVLHRWGWRTVALFAALGCIVLLTLATRGWPSAATAVLLVGLGFCITGTQNAINGAAGVSYPTHVRAAGLGWALGLGRLGSIAGPLIGSLAVILGLSQPRQFFAIPIAPLLIAGGLALWLSRFGWGSASRLEETV